MKLQFPVESVRQTAHASAIHACDSVHLEWSTDKPGSGPGSWILCFGAAAIWLPAADACFLAAHLRQASRIAWDIDPETGGWERDPKLLVGYERSALSIHVLDGHVLLAHPDTAPHVALLSPPVATMVAVTLETSAEGSS